MSGRRGYQLQVVGSGGASSALDLIDNDLGGCMLDVTAVDATFGNPVPVTEVISSLMTDGGLTTVKSFGNRTAVFNVTITGPDLGAVAAGEAELMAALDGVTALAWVVPWAATSYFDVVACWTEHALDDLEEIQQVRRTFRVSFECLPFARSESPVTVSWTGDATELDTLTSISGGSGWTTVSGSATISGGIRTTTSWRGRKTFALDRFLWFKVASTGSVPTTGLISSVTVNGVAIPGAQIREEFVLLSTRFYTVDVSRWRGQSVAVEFTLANLGATNVTLTELWTRSYPGPAVAVSDTRPKGIGVMSVGGTARTPCTISLTAPSGGAFVYTGPDPVAAIRDRGVAESVYGKFTVSAADGAEVAVGSQLMWFPPGDHRANIGVTDPQPLQLNPNGAWPTQASGQALLGTGIAAGATQFAYPTDAKAAITFFDTAGDKTLISPSPALPQGYHGDAVTHEVHTLHPGRCGFAVMNMYGDPINATITYYPRWKHHAAQ